MDLATTHDKQLIRRHSNKHTANSKRVCVRFTTNVVALSFAFEIFFFFTKAFTRKAASDAHFRPLSTIFLYYWRF